MDLRFHGTDDQLENYALGRLPDSELPAIEEHLMVCAGCRQRVDQMEEFALGMRDALVASTAEAALTRRSWLSTVGINWLRKPAFSLALGFAVLIAVLLFASERNRIAPTAALQLTAIRGEMPFSVPARETDLTLVDVPPTAGHFRIEILDAAGRTEWNGMADSGPKGVEVKVQRRLQPGDYFVRLYDSAGEVLHEYGFRVHQ